jgi:hypothetical protein
VVDHGAGLVLSVGERPPGRVWQSRRLCDA